MDWTDDEHTAVLREVAESWARYQTLLDTLATDDLQRPATVGHWSGRDVVAHTANWEEHCVGLVRRWDAGEPKQWLYEAEPADMARWDAWNEEQLRPLDGQSLADVRAYATRVHAELLEMIVASPHVTVDDLHGMTTVHYDFHEADLRALRSGA